MFRLPLWSNKTSPSSQELEEGLTQIAVPHLLPQSPPKAEAFYTSPTSPPPQSPVDPKTLRTLLLIHRKEQAATAVQANGI